MLIKQLVRSLHNISPSFKTAATLQVTLQFMVFVFYLEITNCTRIDACAILGCNEKSFAICRGL